MIGPVFIERCLLGRDASGNGAMGMGMVRDLSCGSGISSRLWLWCSSY
jgi:hypothetical protein